MLEIKSTNIFTDPNYHMHDIVQRSMFMSNLGMYVYEYGLLFILLLIIVFYTNDFNYYNIISRIFSFLMISGTVSLAFPAIWVLMFIFNSNEKNDL